MRKKIIILNYHLVTDEKTGEKLFSVSTSVFLQQLQLLKEMKIPVVNLGDLTTDFNENGFCVALTFDDGYRSHYNTVMPILKEFKYPAVFFPIINRLNESERLNYEQLKEMNERRFTIGSHSLSHTILTKISLKELEIELEQSKKILEEKTGKKVMHFSIPYGWYNKEVILAAKKAGYKYVFATGLKVNNCDSDQFIFHRWNITANTTLDEFKKVIISNGNLPLRIKLTVLLKKGAKKLLGPKLSDLVNRL